jgi:hypothetical protein
MTIRPNDTASGVEDDSANREVDAKGHYAYIGLNLD